MAAPAIVAKTITVADQGDVWAPDGASSAVPSQPVIAPTAVGSTTVTVSISADAGLTSLIPYIDGVPQTAISGSATSHQFTGLSVATGYTLGMQATKTGRVSAIGTAQVTTDDPPVVEPDPPTITFETKSSTTITVDSAGSVGATSYVPVRDGTPLTPEFTAFPYTFTGLTASTEYDCTIRAKNSAGTSADSNTVTQTTDAAPGADVAAAPVSSALYGNTDWTDAAEIARRSWCRIVILQFHPGISAATYSAHIAAVKAAASAGSRPDPLFLMYFNVSERSSGAVWSEFFDDIDDNNFWLRSSWPAGTIKTIQQQAINQAGTRTVGGFTATERQINILFTSHSDVTDQFNGLYFDNWRPVSNTDGDYDEDGVSESATSSAFRNATLIGMAKVKARVLHHRPDMLFFANCGAVFNTYAQNGINDLSAFKALGHDGLTTQNYIGDRNSFYGVFPYDGTAPGGGVKTYPGNVTVSSPVVGTIYQNGFGGWKHSGAVPFGSAPFMGDMMSVIHGADPCANPQNVMIECNGYTESEEITYGSAAQRHNRVCLGSWWCMTDFTPYLHGLNPSPGETGRCVVLTYQQYDWGDWIDPPGEDAGAYATSSGHPVYMRRSENGCVLFNPRYEIAITSPPASITVNVPTLPPGKSGWTLWDGTPESGTIDVPTNDAIFLKAV